MRCSCFKIKTAYLICLKKCSVKMWFTKSINTFQNNKFCSSKLKDFTDGNFKFVKKKKKITGSSPNGWKTLSKEEKLLIMSNFSLSHPNPRVFFFFFFPLQKICTDT